MRLPKITKSQKQERLSLSVPDTLLAQIDAYARYYTEHYGQDITRQEIAKHILEVFIDSDKDFKRWTAGASITNKEDGSLQPAHSKAKKNTEKQPTNEAA